METKELIEAIREEDHSGQTFLEMVNAGLAQLERGRELGGDCQDDG